MVAALHLLHCAAQCAGRLAGLGDDGHQQMGDAVVLSQLDDLGVDEQELASSGLERNSRLMMMLLTQTDLPLPVLPAMSRWGILHRSATWATPAMSLPSANAHRRRHPQKALALEDAADVDRRFLMVRHLDAHGRLAGNGSLHADIGHR